MKEYGSSLANNTSVTELHLVSTRSNDSIATALAESLKVNTTLKVLNLETNYISITGIKSLLEALNSNADSSLEELKIENQRGNIGPGGEQAIADLLDQNTSLRKFSYLFKFPGPRQKSIAAIMRNCDVTRQKRKK